MDFDYFVFVVCDSETDHEVLQIKGGKRVIFYSFEM